MQAASSEQILNAYSCVCVCVCEGNWAIKSKKGVGIDDILTCQHIGQTCPSLVFKELQSWVRPRVEFLDISTLQLEYPEWAVVKPDD